PRIGTTKSPDQQLDVDRPAVSGQIHQQPCIAAVPATGDATAQRARRSRSGALGGDGNVCRGKFLLPDDQTDASKKSPHTAKPRSKRSQRGSQLSRKLLLPAAALHRNCGRPNIISALTAGADKSVEPCVAASAGRCGLLAATAGPAPDKGRLSAPAAGGSCGIPMAQGLEG